MRLLLDTHILLWLMQDAPQLSSAARRLLSESESVFVSSVSLWEIAIKAGLGKLQVDQSRLDTELAGAGIQPLPVSFSHVRALRDLALLHTDPFDRLLVAQAVSEPLHFLTHDEALRAYSPLVVIV